MNVENTKSLVNEEYENLVEKLVKVAMKWTSEEPSNRLLTLKIVKTIKFYCVKTHIRFENESFGFYFQYGLEDSDIEFNVDFKYSSITKNNETIVHGNYYKELINELSIIIEENLAQGQKS